ncbi:heme-dependent oxidative N-demethylase family protein [Aspergillus undulatus]|uniref:heme-dependent oxidative N-demethylase family protein n=1 Tax=Aspergillus undulatus TaxID=1810928 RepID=UPI003CCDC2A3
MDALNIQDNPWLSGLALITLAGLFLTLFTFASGSRINFPPNRKASTSQTPPLSISPEKKIPPAQKPSAPAPNPNPLSTLPPQRRHTLKALLPNVPYIEIPEDEILRHILPMIANWTECASTLARGEKGLQVYTPTGFSITEIEALGDFPDYALLSGVPLPTKYEGFDIERALPRPYRPFRWAYHQTMSLTKLEPDWWLELENTYRTRIAQRKALFAKHNDGVLDSLPGSELACKELMEMVVQFLCTRYPQYFTLVDKRVLVNRILGTEQDVRSKPPLEILMDNVPEDFGIMLRDDVSGNYFLRAGVICSSMGWNVKSKVGLQLHRIHDEIPDYMEKMRFSMDRFFTKMPTDKPIQRGSWGLEIGQPLHMPPGDPHEKLRTVQDPNLKLEDCHLRIDWQTLRRLPLSGAIAFNFKALFTPVAEFRDEPCVPALLAKVMKEGKENLMKYKGTMHVEHVVLPKLEEWAIEQEDKGLAPKDWEVATLDDSPWFKGWQDKWHRQQGF